jgi:nitrate/nitrite transport system ATP-binding protein
MPETPQASAIVAHAIGQILDVELPRPRDRIALAGNGRYNHCRQEILTFLYEKQRKIERIGAARARPESKSGQALRA